MEYLDIINDIKNSKWSINVEKFFKEKKDQIIENGKAEHAVLLIKHLFDDAIYNVCISSGCLPDKANIDKHGFIVKNNSCHETNTKLESDEIYNDSRIKQAVLNFLQKENTSLDIAIYETFDHTQSKFLNFLKENKVINKVKLFQKADQDLPAVHFMVNDNNAYRLELDAENNRVHARANAYDTREAGILKYTFEKICNQFQHIPIR